MSRPYSKNKIALPFSINLKKKDLTFKVKASLRVVLIKLYRLTQPNKKVFHIKFLIEKNYI